MIISSLNSIRFAKVDSNYRNFGNTLLSDEKFYSDEIFDYCQRFLTSDIIEVQIKSDFSAVPTAILTKADKTTESLIVTQASAYDQDGDSVNDLFFFEFSVSMSAYTTESFITVNQDDTWKSEPFKGDADLLTELQDGESQQIEFYNDDNAFSIDFSTGITFKSYVESIVKDYEAGGEASIYDNQDEITKLKETVTRMFTLKTLYVPRYVAERLRLASACDNFIVNGVSFIREDMPEISPVEGCNLVEVSMKLIDKEYIGVNTHDIGFDVDTPANGAEIMIKSELNASGSVTFSIPAGYMVHTLRAQWVSGTAVTVKLGTTLGGDELVYPTTISGTITQVTVAIHGDINRDSDVDIYVTITGGVANIDLQLIQNKE
jgi:hypothetical protein